MRDEGVEVEERRVKSWPPDAMVSYLTYANNANNNGDWATQSIANGSFPFSKSDINIHVSRLNCRFCVCEMEGGGGNRDCYGVLGNNKW